MIVGVGLDVCSIDRMRKALERHGDRFFSRICSDAEKADLTGRDAATSLAGRFAAKEAFAKALDGAPGVGWHEIHVRRTSTGRPRLELLGNALALAREHGASRWHLSITHDAGVAAAVVVPGGGVIPVLSREQARAFDEATIGEARVPGLVLMENAGRGAVDAIAAHWPERPLAEARVLVVAGVGNNGGDGFVVARHLLTRGARVEVFVVGGAAKVQGDARTHLEALRGLGVAVEEASADVTSLRAAAERSTLVVDAVFGTGLARAVEGAAAAVLDALQHADRAIVALDLPSGLDADTGVALGTALRADLTVTFAWPKLGLLTPNGARFAGHVVVADLGVPPRLPDGVGCTASLLEHRDVVKLVKARGGSTHKNTAGHVVIFAGSPGHLGASLMSAHGAFRAGAGLVTIASWPAVVDVLDGRVQEVMTARLSPDRLAESVDAVLARAKVVVMGPGFGKDDAARAVVRYILSKWEGPSVVDADALGMFADEAEVFASSKGAAVLTPHPGELGVLLGTSAKQVEADRFGALATCVERARSVTVLKGAHTLVGAPEERPVINGSGNGALATAGSGDVLSGTIGALACTLDPFEAAFVGVHLHGLAAEAWSRRHGDRGLLAGEIADEYPALFGRLAVER